MADINARFTNADQSLAFALSWFASCRHRDSADTEMMLAVVREVLPSVSEDHPMVAPLVTAAQHLEEAHALDNASLLASAQLEVAAAVATFAKWRTGRAFDDFRTARAAA